MHRRAPLLLLAAIGLLAGCGGQPGPAPRPAAAEETGASGPATAPGTLLVGQEGTAPAATLWYVRVEDMNGEPLAETSFPNTPIDATWRFAAARYRVLSWHRSCAGTCPATGEEGLGPLESVCGTPVTITAGADTGVTVVIAGDGTCTATPAP